MQPFLTLLVLLLSIPLFSQNVTGKWKTIDDDSDEAKSVVEIYKATDGSYYGKIVDLYLEPGEDPNPVCTECDEEDRRYKQKLRGMVIITSLEKDGDYYAGGEILDPENGNTYRCKIWTDGAEKLMVRGYLGPFYRTQEWVRVR